MNHLDATQWGGRVGRYAEFRGAVGRCRDPFAGHPVEFEFAYEYEAWLRQRFCADTVAITCRRTPVAAVDTDRELKAVATFIVTDRIGRQTYHLASRDKQYSQSGVKALRRVARHTGAHVAVITQEELRRDLKLFWRLELLRQAAAIHEGEGDGFDPQIVAAVAARPGHVSGLGEVLSHIEPQLLRARLAHLHCRGRLRLDFASDDFSASLPEERLS